MLDARTLPIPERPRKPATVLRLDTPRTRALVGLEQLRRLARAKVEPGFALLMLNLALGGLSAVEQGHLSDDADIEARRLYRRILRACTKAAGGSAKLTGAIDERPDAPVIDLAIERARRAGGAS